MLAKRSTPPTVLLVGPGAVTRVMRPFLHDAADEAPPSLLRRLRTDLARFADQALRRIPTLPLVSLEPRELRTALGQPVHLVVVDVSRRVLEAVRRDDPDAECHALDISHRDLPVTADVVVAFNVVSRIANGAVAVAHLTAAVAAGGLLLLDDRSARRWLIPHHPEFSIVMPKIYRRTAAAGPV